MLVKFEVEVRATFLFFFLLQKSNFIFTRRTSYSLPCSLFCVIGNFSEEVIVVGRCVIGGFVRMVVLVVGMVGGVLGSW